MKRSFPPPIEALGGRLGRESSRKGAVVFGWIPAFAGMTMALVGCATLNDVMMPLGPPGNPARGRELFATRDEARCVLCHAAPGVEGGGNLGPALAGVGSRLSAAQIRLRVADITRVNPEAVMPTFHRVEGMRRVAPQYEGKPVLNAAQVEDLVAWLETLR